jgi:DNA-binding PadR family transcriptional regulator
MLYNCSPGLVFDIKVLNNCLGKKTMIPESKLIRSEITLRELSLPNDVILARKSLVRWLALSLGLITPNESRRLLLDVFEVLLESHIRKEALTTRDILDQLERANGEKQNPKAVYYHLLKLKDSGLISRRKGRYYLGEGEDQRLASLFRQFYESKADNAFGNIEMALNRLEGSFGEK